MPRKQERWENKTVAIWVLQRGVQETREEEDVINKGRSNKKGEWREGGRWSVGYGERMGSLLSHVCSWMLKQQTRPASSAEENK